MIAIAVDSVSDFCVVFDSHSDSKCANLFVLTQNACILTLCNTLQIKVEWCNCCVLIQCAKT